MKPWEPTGKKQKFLPTFSTSAKKCAQQLLEELATIDEANETFMMKVLENPDSLTQDEIHAVIRKGVCHKQNQPCSLRISL